MGHWLNLAEQRTLNPSVEGSSPSWPIYIPQTAYLKSQAVSLRLFVAEAAARSL